MMEHLVAIIEVVTACCYVFSIIVLVWGVIRCAVLFLKVQLQRHGDSEEGLWRITKSKNALGVYILLSLEILIVADIMESIVRPTFQDLIRLGAIVAIRTVISYFLNKEIRETQGMMLPGEGGKERG